jgi:cysteine synthase
MVDVEPPPGDSIQGLRCLEEYIPPVLDLKLITERRVVTSQQAEETARRLLKLEGIFAGLSAGAVAYQAVKLAGEIKEGNIVAVLADAGWKYLSLDFWQR